MIRRISKKISDRKSTGDGVIVVPTNQINNKDKGGGDLQTKSLSKIDTEVNINGKHTKMQLSKRRSKTGEDETDYVPELSTSKQEFQSTINQRPRRAVKHKFIKSANNSLMDDPIPQINATLPNKLDFPISIPAAATLTPRLQIPHESKPAAMSPNAIRKLPEVQLESRKKKNQSDKLQRRSGRQTVVSNSSKSIPSNDSLTTQHTDGNDLHTPALQIPQNIEFGDNLSNDATDAMDYGSRNNGIKIEPTTATLNFNDNSDQQSGYDVYIDDDTIDVLGSNSESHESEVTIRDGDDDQEKYHDIIYVEDDSDDNALLLDDIDIEQADESIALQESTEFDRFADDGDSVILVTGTEECNDISNVESSMNTDSKTTHISPNFRNEMEEPKLPVKKRGRPRKISLPLNSQIEETSITDKLESQDLQDISENFKSVTIDQEAVQVRANITNVANSLQTFTLNSSRPITEQKSVISAIDKTSSIKAEHIESIDKNVTESYFFPEHTNKSEVNNSEHHMSPKINILSTDKLVNIDDSGESSKEYLLCQSIRSRPRRQSVQVKNYCMRRSYKVHTRRLSAECMNNETSTDEKNNSLLEIGSALHINSNLHSTHQTANAASSENIFLINNHKDADSMFLPHKLDHNVFSRNTGEMTDREASDLLLQLSESTPVHQTHYRSDQSEANTYTELNANTSQEEKEETMIDQHNNMMPDSKTQSAQLVSPDIKQEEQTEIVEHSKRRGRGRPKRTKPESEQYISSQRDSQNCSLGSDLVEDTHNTALRTTRRSTRVPDITTETQSIARQNVPIESPSTKGNQRLDLEMKSIEHITDTAPLNTSAMCKEFASSENRDVKLFNESMSTEQTIIPNCESKMKSGSDTKSISSIEKIKDEEELAIAFSSHTDRQNINLNKVDKDIVSLSILQKAVIDAEISKEVKVKEELNKSSRCGQNIEVITPKNNIEFDFMNYKLEKCPIDLCGQDEKVTEQKRADKKQKGEYTHDDTISITKIAEYSNSELFGIECKPNSDESVTNKRNSVVYSNLHTNQPDVVDTTPNNLEHNENELPYIIFRKESLEELDDSSNIRRSGRIKTINQSKRRSCGQGVVKERDRANVTVIEEELSNASVDIDIPMKSAVSREQLTLVPASTTVKTAEQREQERIDRENGLKLFISILDNKYRSERIISKEAKKMTCDCFLTPSEIERGELGCGEDCLNRMLLIECGPKCMVTSRCTNKRFQTHQNADCTIFKTEKKGYGLVASSLIPSGSFIMEYVGEVLNSKQFEKRALEYSQQMNAHYYFMALSSDRVIDATKRGNISRFINHSCNPNAETQKWTVNGELRIGFFSIRDINPEEEITFDYQFQRYGKEAQRCFCEATNCRGWIGGEPESDEEDDDDEDSDEELAEVDKESQQKTDDHSDFKEDRKKIKVAKSRKPRDPNKKRIHKEKSNTKANTDKVFKKHLKTTSAEIREDPDLEKEIEVLAKTGLKNQVHTLQLSRLCVRAKLLKAKTQLLLILRGGARPCLRLFLDYRGLKLIHSWMADCNAVDRMTELKFRLDILQTLENLPITNKTMLQDSKVLACVERWSKKCDYIEKKSSHTMKVTNDESSPSDSGSGTPISYDGIASPKIEEAALSEQIIASGSADITTLNLPVMKTEAADNCSNSNSDSSTNDVGATASTTIIVKQTEILKNIPQLIERSSALKDVGVDMLKRIISTNEKNNEIIEDSQTNDKLPDGELGKLVREIRLLAMKLVTTWEQLHESFRIPKKLRIEQMKEHEREADQSYPSTMEEVTPTEQAVSIRFHERFGTVDKDRITDPPEPLSHEKDPRHRSNRYKATESAMQKLQRRQMFEAKVAQEQKKSADELIEFNSKCAFFRLDSNRTYKDNVPYCVNPTTGQWYGQTMTPIPTPPSHAHIKPPPRKFPTDINEYYIPKLDLPDHWKYSINDQGHIYYYHDKILIPQWELPIKLLPLMSNQPAFKANIPPENEIIEEITNKSDDDDDDDDVDELMSNSNLDTSRLLALKSDPDLEKYNDEDFSSSDSDDSSLEELEMTLNYMREQTNNYFINIRKPNNLHEEIMALAKTDSSGSTTSPVYLYKTSDDKSGIHCPNPEREISMKKNKKNREKLVQEFRISPLSDEMKRELRLDARRYKENKLKLRRYREIQKERKATPSEQQPARKIRKLTDGIPVVAKIEPNDNDDNRSFKPIQPRLDVHLETRKSKLSPYDSNIRVNSHSKQVIASSDTSSSTSLTHLLVSKLPSIGHKFVPDTKELIAKNSKPATLTSTPPLTSSKPVKIISTSPAPSRKCIEPGKSSPKPSSKRKRLTEGEYIDGNSSAGRKLKDKFRFEISSDVVRHLRPYFNDTCELGRITSAEDFRHLAKKLTFGVMTKELKNCCNNVKLLEVTDSVKGKAREYIRKYMSKFGEVYIKPENEVEFKGDDLNLSLD